MKKVIVILAVLAIAGPAMAAITGSAHDFSALGWSGGEICISCHAPHGGTTGGDSPLWNHDVTGVTTYALYSSNTLTAGPLGQPSGVSKLCLSCHDGTIALDSFGGAVGATSIDAAYQVGGGNTLVNEHPISFTYDDTLAGSDGELHTPSDTASGLGGFIAADMLFSGSLECSSCHDVHDGRDLGPTGKLLVMSNANSDLCLTCHDK